MNITIMINCIYLTVFSQINYIIYLTVLWQIPFEVADVLLLQAVKLQIVISKIINKLN